jgi:hypothetical protein
MSTKLSHIGVFLITSSFAIGFLIVSSCSTMKINAVKSGKSLYETFYVGEEGTQYFIKVLEFENNSKQYSEFDFTFRYQNKTEDSAILNISVFAPHIFRNLDSLRLSNNKFVYVIENINHLFTDRNKNMFKSRFSTTISLTALKNLFLHDNWALQLYSNNEKVGYSTPAKTRKKINKLNYAIFDTF